MAARARPPVSRLVREGVLDGREHLGRDPRGEGAGAARPLDGDRAADHGRRALGSERGDRARAGARQVPRGLAGRAERGRVRRPGRARRGGEPDRRPPRARDVRPDREPHHRGQVARHLRGAGDGAALHRLRAARERDPQRGHDRQLPHDGQAPRAAPLRGPLVRSAGADAAPEPAELDRARGQRRGHDRAPAGRRLHAARHDEPERDLSPGPALDGERREHVRAGRPHRAADDAPARPRGLARQARALRQPRADARRARSSCWRARSRRARTSRSTPASGCSRTPSRRRRPTRRWTEGTG